MINRGPSSPMTRDFRLHPLWLEFIEYHGGFSKPLKLAAYVAEQAAYHRTPEERRTIEHWQQLQRFGIENLSLRHCTMDGLPNLIEQGVLEQGSHGCVQFFYGDIHGVGALCAFWAESVGAAEEFVKEYK
jgi:hypothetical protein